MARKIKKQVNRHVGYFALVKSDIVSQVEDPNGVRGAKKNVKKSKFVRVGFLEPTKELAVEEARKRYGAAAQIIVEGSRVDVRPFYIYEGEKVYGEYKVGPKQMDFACGSSRAGKYC